MGSITNRHLYLQYSIWFLLRADNTAGSDRFLVKMETIYGKYLKLPLLQEKDHMRVFGGTVLL